MTLINSELIIDPNIFSQNISYIKNKIKNSSKFLAVIKSDAYGHLLENIVSDIDDLVDGYGVVRADEAKKINAICVLDNGKALTISQLATLIKNSSFVVANDTGPAHMAAHLNVKGLTLFGSHTTASKVSIEREKFKAIEVSDLNKLSAAKVFEILIQNF